MVRLLTLTTIFLSSLTAFTMAATMADKMANLLQLSQNVDTYFNAFHEIIDRPQAFGIHGSGHQAVLQDVGMISDNIRFSWDTLNSIKDVDFANPGNKADLEKIRNVLQRTYGKDGDSDKACQKLTNIAQKLKDFEKAKKIEKGKGKTIAEAFDKLLQNHGELVHSMTKFGDTGIPEMMHHATKLLLSTYFSLAS